MKAGLPCPKCGGSVLPMLAVSALGAEEIMSCVQCGREPFPPRPSGEELMALKRKGRPSRYARLITHLGRVLEGEGKYDDPDVVHWLRLEERRREYVRAVERGMTVGETARSYGVSERTVYRALTWAQKEGVDG